MSRPSSTSTPAEGASEAARDAHLRAAAALGRVGNRAGQIEALRRALAHDPEHAPAHAALGDALLRMGRLGEARDACRAALALDAGSVDAHRTLGVILFRRFSTRVRGLDHLREAARLAPEMAVAHYELAAALTRLTHRREARACLARACELAPLDPAILAAAARRLIELRRFGEARALAARAFAAGPDHPAALAVEAHFRLREGLRGEAVELARAALVFDPADGDAAAALAEAEMTGRWRYAAWTALRRWDEMSLRRMLPIMAAFCLAPIGLVLLFKRFAPAFGAPALLALMAGFAASALAATLVYERRTAAARRPVKLDRRF